MYLLPFTNSEILDILVVASQILCPSICEVKKEMALELVDLSKRTKVKRKISSAVSKLPKHHQKVKLLEMMDMSMG